MFHEQIQSNEGINDYARNKSRPHIKVAAGPKKKPAFDFQSNRKVLHRM